MRTDKDFAKAVENELKELVASHDRGYSYRYYEGYCGRPYAIVEAFYTPEGYYAIVSIVDTGAVARCVLTDRGFVWNKLIQ